MNHPGIRPCPGRLGRGILARQPLIARSNPAWSAILPADYETGSGPDQFRHDVRSQGLQLGFALHF